MPNFVVTIDQAGVDQIKEMSLDTLDEIGLEIAAAANPPVDTGFLRASAYVHSPRQSTFDATWPSDYYTNREGKLVERERVDAPPDPGQDEAIVGWAAVYAWVVEDRQPFIYPALLDATTLGDSFSYDRGTGRYRNRATGRFASESSIFGLE